MYLFDPLGSDKIFQALFLDSPRIKDIATLELEKKKRVEREENPRRRRN